MGHGVTRRGLLQRLGVAIGLGAGASGTARASQQIEPSAFIPVEHGYGFRNWASREQTFEPPPGPPQGSIRDQVRTEWQTQARAVLGIDMAELPVQLTETIATQVRLAIVQRAGTNGHCYGMCLTAQQYFEDPESIPVDSHVASDIRDPTVPLDDPDAPVYEAIVEAQANQYLGFRAWLGRRGMLYPDHLDTERICRDIQAVVETVGTASLSLFDRNLGGHQVLAYGFEERDGGVTIPIYDPNRPAQTYRHQPAALQFGRDGDDLTMQPYDGFPFVLFNRYDQIDRATDRTYPNPLDHTTMDVETLRASLFPLALVLADTPDVRLTVTDPDGNDLDRIRSDFMDRTRGAYARIRTRYGAPPGTYTVSVFATDATDYELTTTVADTGGTIVDATRAGSLDAGDVHTFELAVPDSGDGSLSRIRRDVSELAVVGSAGAVGGAAVGALGYRVLQGSDGE